jgi:type II secretory pathway pseudopilin PulG
MPNSPNTVDFGDALTDQQLFDDAAITPEPAAQPVPETPEEPSTPVETPTGRLKDPVTGKFVAKEAKEPEAAAPEPPEAPAEAPEPEEPQMPAHVPSWRLAEEAQRRREAEAQNYAAQQQLRQMQLQMAQWQEQQQAQQEPVDPITNPIEYQQVLQQALQKEVANIRLESNLQIAQFRHQDVFDKAYEAFVENSYAGDQATYLSVMRSPNPGEAIVRWYTNRETLNRVGPDPEAFIQAEIERRMTDPAFQAEVIKRYQAQNGSSPSNQQVRLPPSLSRVSSAAPAAEGELDTSDAAMYAFATKR